MVSDEKLLSIIDEYIIKPSEEEFYRTETNCLKHKKDGILALTLFTKGAKEYAEFTIDLCFKDTDLENKATVLQAIDEQMHYYFWERFPQSELYLQYEDYLEEFFDDLRDELGTIMADAGGGESVPMGDHQIEDLEFEIREEFELYYVDLGMLYFDELQDNILKAIGDVK